MNTSEVLNRAADLIEERGWTAGTGWDHQSGGPLCLEGGIAAAAGLPFNASWGCPAYKAVADYLKSRTSDPPFMWNDGLPHLRVMAAIDCGECTPDNMTEVRAEAEEWAATEVISLLRACALIEAAREEQDAAWETYAEVVVA